MKDEDFQLDAADSKNSLLSSMFSGTVPLQREHNRPMSSTVSLGDMGTNELRAEDHI